jgi:hypothetical protein
MDLAFVRRVVADLADHGCTTWIFGGWAEELRGVCPPRQHGDLDLLYPAASFAALDDLFERGALTEIPGKRFPHKRAFVVEGEMVEVFLVQTDGSGSHTEFWSTVRYDWPAGTFGSRQGLRVASEAALADYRRQHRRLHGSSPESVPGAARGTCYARPVPHW